MSTSDARRSFACMQWHASKEMHKSHTYTRFCSCGCLKQNCPHVLVHEDTDKCKNRSTQSSCVVYTRLCKSRPHGTRLRSNSSPSAKATDKGLCLEYACLCAP